MRYNGRAIIACAFFAVVPFLGAMAQAGSASVDAFPDFLSIRAEFLSAAVTAAPARALAFKPTLRDSPAGRVRVSVERDGDSFFVMFLRERDGAYPVGSRGNVVIKRSVETGYVTRVVWYLSDDGLSFLSLTPKNERTVIDYVVGGSLSRGEYTVSNLIYYFFTNSFRYLYNATRAGLDWSLVFGPPGPGPATRIGSAIVSASPSGASAALLDAADDFTSIGAYLSAAGYAGTVPLEESAGPSAKAASFEDPRDPRLASASPWSEARGLPLESSAAVVLAGIESGSAFIALVSGVGAMPPLNLAVVPYRSGDGSYVIAAVDAKSRAPVDFGAVVASRPGASVRLFRVPLPPSD